jgi:hypothetical protein
VPRGRFKFEFCTLSNAFLKVRRGTEAQETRRRPPTNDQHHQQQQQYYHTMDNTTTTSLLHQQQSFFHTDGYILLPSLLSPSFISQLHTECLDIFRSVLDWLTLVGAADFEESCRLRQANSKSNNDELLEEYEYPIKLGIKNGYQELVMRSPGRYELALLILEEEMSAATNHSRNANTEIMTNNFITEACYYNDKRLMTVEMIEQAKRQFLAKANGDDIIGGYDEKRSVKNIETASTEAPTSSKRRTSCLRQLLGWIKQYENKSSFNDDATTKENDVQHDDDNSSDDNLMHKSTQNYEHIEAAEKNIDDETNFKAFMELVSAIFSPSATTTCGSQEKTNVTDDEYYLCNLSLLISTPGSPTQSWHADGGHMSLTTHHPCHVFNVFIPLVDLPLSMGPTELRPGSHVYTRDLTRMMLIAKAKKLLRETVVAEMGRGDALVFDYRILHRGRANMSDRVVVGANDGEGNDNDEDHVVEESSRQDDDGGNSGTNNTSNKCHGSGRDRPVLVLTFSRSWFVDVCNFPKRSIFSLLEKNES